MFNYSKLLGRIKEFGYTQEQVATAIGKSETTFSAKLKGKTSFTTKEIDGLCKILNIPASQIAAYFFAK